MKLSRSILVLVLALPAAAAAQTPAPYRPGLGDLMTMTVQPRHLKLGLAGQEKNWPYVVYEGHELEEAFERVVKQVPKWREFDIAQLIAATVKQPLDDLEAAAKVRDGPRFEAAYRQLTDACNACHQAVQRPFVTIQEPNESMFPDQNFHAQP